ncbi:MAG: DMT family transporter [Alphaproteobacteria bacterium]|nr:DMT family transporter [Alphaproteobacteria bacterium]
MFPQSAALRGALYALGAAAGFAVMVALIRHLTETLHPFQVVFFRNLFGLACMLPWLAGAGLGALRTRRLGLYLTRGAVSLASMLAWFSGLALLPLDHAVALSFTAPLFTTMLAAGFLKEAVSTSRWAATGIGFCGALLVIKPGFAGGSPLGVAPATLLVLVSAVLTAIAIIVIKSLVRTEKPNAVVAYMTLVLAPLSLPFALPVWTWPDAEGWAVAVAIGGLATFAHLCFARALAAADASFVMAFDYARLPIAALIAFYAFGETPDLLTFVGGAVIAGAALSLARRESAINLAPPSR